ncbi:unnamed protein product [Eretmochelys imbricata]
MALMKSGWLWRQSSILRRWKRNWFVLWLDGGLVYYQDETQRDLEGRIHIKFNCRDIKTGRECRDVQPPEGKSRDCLMTIVLRDGSKVTLCAESEDDAVAWKMAVLEAKNTPVHMYNPYDDYYQTVPLDSHQTITWSDSCDCPRGPLPRVGRPDGFGPAGWCRHRGCPGILHVDAVLVLGTRSPAGRLCTKRLTEKFGFPPGGLRGDAL